MHAKSRIEARELERVQAGRDELVERIARLVAEDGSIEAAPGLDLFRYSSPTGPVYAVNEPSFCIIVQGSKELLLGNERYRYDASRYLLVSAGLPVVGRILEGTKERPYLAVRIGLDPALVTAVLMESGLLPPRASRAIKAVAVSRLDADLLDSVVRLVRLVDAPRDYAALAPLAIREIVYRLALGEQGGRLCQIALNAGRAHRIARAIELVRKSYDQPLRIPPLSWLPFQLRARGDPSRRGGCGTRTCHFGEREQPDADQGGDRPGMHASNGGYAHIRSGVIRGRHLRPPQRVRDASSPCLADPPLRRASERAPRASCRRVAEVRD